MRYLFINSVYGKRSTGKIVMKQCHELQKQGHECLVAYGREAIVNDVNVIRIGNNFDCYMHVIMSRLFDMHGLGSKKATKIFLKQIEKYSPDVIWLHNLHGYYINYEILFDWLKRHSDIKVYWTLHDCWAFTGHCVYFTMAKCDKWKYGCFNCPQLKTYPKATYFDYSQKNYLRKKKAFSNVHNLKLITPSKWLSELANQSILSEYSVKVINNSIDKTIFKPTRSDFRNKYHLNYKYLILGVAVGWEKTKGLQDMYKVREKLNKNYIILLVGATKKQIKSFPKGIIGITRTENQKELASIYSAADVFLNPTHQDNYPTVNLEAKACGTPVITYNVGGSPESIDNLSNIIEENDIDGLVERIIEICEETNEEIVT